MLISPIKSAVKSPGVDGWKNSLLSERQNFKANSVQYTDTEARDAWLDIYGETVGKKAVFGTNYIRIDGATNPFTTGTITVSGCATTANNKAVAITIVSGQYVYFAAGSWTGATETQGQLTDGTNTVQLAVSPTYPQTLTSLSSFDLFSRGIASDGLVEVGNGANNGTVSTRTNLLGADGNFGTDSNADGLGDGWTVIGTTSALSMSGNIQHFTVSSVNSRILRTMTSTVGLSIYVFAYVSATSSSVRMSVSNNSAPWIAHTGSGNFEFLSGIGTNTATAPFLYIQDTRESAWNDIAVKQAGVIALTGILAKLTKAEMDKLVKYCLATYGYANEWNVKLAAILQTIALKDTSSVALSLRGRALTFNTDGTSATWYGQDRIIKKSDGKWYHRKNGDLYGDATQRTDFYYLLSTPIDTELHSDNQTALNAVAKTYDGVTNIVLSTYYGELSADQWSKSAVR